jgi:hypothetical protein
MNIEHWKFTKHAVARYRERTGCTRSDETIKNRIGRRLQNKIHLFGRVWYAEGLVFVLRGNLVITVLKAHNKRVQNRVFEIFSESRAK